MPSNAPYRRNPGLACPRRKVGLRTVLPAVRAKLEWEEGQVWQTDDGKSPEANFVWVIHKPDAEWLERFVGGKLAFDKTLADIPQPICQNCGMAFTVRDVVEGALEAKVHTKEELAHWLATAGKAAGSGRVVDDGPKRLYKCSKCGASENKRIIIFSWKNTTGEGGFDWVM
ncbi:hypothetical protein GPECTOR_2g1524 [Gonium pectorale]|uniref:Uncharacterized protein n=1 Tax=Gonium pectorale TaxID=33097 RepID=A0A150H1X3_GONPE|nr:hypothetical protein GPECTOR_2g1524 [Gonium pectorale]|eukprot:KXZ55972.1 hypothetical protein GPECTOR_2g1524 [Gonium pectorale]